MDGVMENIDNYPVDPLKLPQNTSESNVEGNGEVTEFSKRKKEIPINGLIARVHLNQLPVEGYLSVGEERPETIQGKRKRGRPRKVQKESLTDQSTNSSERSSVDTDSVSESCDSESTLLVPIKKKKYSENFHHERRRKSFQQVNGNKKPSRVRKPNSKLQDFVTSSRYSYSPTPKPKQKDKEITKGLNKSKSDVIDKNDEVVRSFLPVFDDHDEENNTLQVKPSPRKYVKEKENKKQPSLQNRTSVSNGNLSENIHTKPIYSHADLSETSINMLHKRNNETSTAGPLAKKLRIDATTDVTKAVKKIVVAKITKVNGLNVKSEELVEGYCLVDNIKKNKAPQLEAIDFNKLVRCLKSVKLPAPNWKIRIVVSKQQNITEVTFTNKEAYERCIKFSRTIVGYVITFGKSTVRLLGAPTRISSFNDVSILLDIIHNLSADDPVLEYSTDTSSK